jgi:hypothetical protein
LGQNEFGEGAVGDESGFGVGLHDVRSFRQTRVDGSGAPSARALSLGGGVPARGGGLDGPARLPGPSQTAHQAGFRPWLTGPG